MSIIACDKCSDLIDSDDDEFCFGDEGDGFGKYQCLCETCREDYYDELEYLAGVGA